MFRNLLRRLRELCDCSCRGQSQDDIDSQEGVVTDADLPLSRLQIRSIQSRKKLVEYTSRKNEVYQATGIPVGEGAFSEVFLMRRVRDGRILAAKFSIPGHYDSLLQLHHEYKLLRKMNHRNIIRAFDFFHCDLDVGAMLMPYYQTGTLEDRLEKVGRFVENEARVYVRQLFEALDYLHERCILHGDIKPANIICCYNVPYNVNEDQLIDNPTGAYHHYKYRLRLVDFGLAVQLSGPGGSVRAAHGTACYMAPEIEYRNKMSLKCDIWSAGVTTFQLLTGDIPFKTMRALPTLDILRISKYFFGETQLAHLSEDGKQFLLLTLDYNFNTRYTASQSLAHVWINPFGNRRFRSRLNILNIARAALRGCEKCGHRCRCHTAKFIMTMKESYNDRFIRPLRRGVRFRGQTIVQIDNAANANAAPPRAEEAHSHDELEVIPRRIVRTCLHPHAACGNDIVTAAGTAQLPPRRPPNTLLRRLFTRAMTEKNISKVKVQPESQLETETSFSDVTAQSDLGSSSKSKSGPRSKLTGSSAVQSSAASSSPKKRHRKKETPHAEQSISLRRICRPSSLLYGLRGSRSRLARQRLTPPTYQPKTNDKSKNLAPTAKDGQSSAHVAEDFAQQSVRYPVIPRRQSIRTPSPTEETSTFTVQVDVHRPNEPDVEENTPFLSDTRSSDIE